MVKCCARGCRNPGTHIFPKDDKVRILWEKAVNKNFKSTRHSRLCSEHFTSEDYIAEGFYTGLQHERKILKKGVVPSSFKNLENKTRTKIRKQTHPTIVLSAQNSDNSIKPEHNIKCVKVGSQKQNHCSIGTQKFFCLFSIDSFKDDNKKIYFYTGLKTYDLFIKVFKSLGPDADSLCYKRNQDLDMHPKDQLLLTLTKLKRNHDDYELAFFFDVHLSSVANIVKTWVNFIYSKWKDKYKIYGQMLNVLDEGGTNILMHDNLSEPNSFTIKENLSKSTVQSNLDNLRKMFFIVKGQEHKEYMVLLPQILFICTILLYFTQDT